MSIFLLVVISVIFLLTIASYASMLAQRLRFPFTIFLFVIGVGIVLLGKYIPSLDILFNLEFSKDLVFYIFLPTLLFESTYNMPYQKLLKDASPILGLSIVSLLLSTIIVGVVFKVTLSLLGFDIPYMVSFLFGAIISATDPVAVLAIFKDYGVPKRLTHLFEGESIMNDGTAVALFLIIMGIIEAGTQVSFSQIAFGTLSFLFMIIGGAVFGVLMGFIFSKLIQWAKHSWSELTLTLILAHTTFILAELVSEHFAIFKISAIIATAFAAFTLGNYGRYKISSQVREMMETTWGYFAFISNSLIFLLMGMMIGRINFHVKELIIPIAIAIAVVMLARALSVFAVIVPLNKWVQDPIPFAWQKLLAWGSLRGAIAITMLLFIPKNFTVPGWTWSLSVYEFLSVIVISCIVFTLIIKATTIGGMIRKMKLAKLSKVEEFSLHQIKEIIDKSILRRLNDIQEDQYVPDMALNILIEKYETDDKKEIEEIKRCSLHQEEFEKLLRRYSLGIERRSVIEAFESKQVNEMTLKRILRKIENQYMRLEMGLAQTKDTQEKNTRIQLYFQRGYNWFYFRNDPERFLKSQYIFYRTRSLLSGTVMAQLRQFQEEFYPSCESTFKKVIKQYEGWYDDAQKKMYAIEGELGEGIYKEEARMLNHHLVHLEEGLIQTLYSKHIISGKVRALLRKSLWDE